MNVEVEEGILVTPLECFIGGNNPNFSPDGGDISSSCVFPGAEEKVPQLPNPHNMLMEELKSFTAEKRKLRPVGVVNPSTRGQSDTKTSTNKQSSIGVIASPKEATKLVPLPNQSPILVSNNKSSRSSRNGKVKVYQSPESTSDEEEAVQIKDLSKLLVGLQQQIEKLSTKERKKKNRNQKEKKQNGNGMRGNGAVSMVSIDPEPRFVTLNDEEESILSQTPPPTNQPVRLLEIPMKEECDNFEVVACEADSRYSSTISQPPLTPGGSEKNEKAEPVAAEEKGTCVKVKLHLDGILERRASLRSNSSSFISSKARESPTTAAASQSNTQNPNYQSFVQDFKNFSFKRKVVTNAHRLSCKNSTPVVNERILNKDALIIPAHKAKDSSLSEVDVDNVVRVKVMEKKVFNGKPSSLANEIGKSVNIEQPLQKVGKKKEKAAKPKVKAKPKPEPVEMMESQNSNDLDSSEEEEQATLDSASNLDLILASLSPQQLLKLQEKCKSKIETKISRKTSKGQNESTFSSKPKPTNLTNLSSSPPPPPPPPLSTVVVVPDASPHHSHLLQQIKSFSRRKLKATTSQRQVGETSSGLSTRTMSSEQEPTGNPRVLTDVLLRRFEALNGDETEESSNSESSSDSDHSWNE